MIISVEELKQYITTTESDQELEAKLQALESLIRSYTHNSFENRAFRKTVDIMSGIFVCKTTVPFKVGDTVQVSGANLNAGLYTVASVNDDTFEVKESVLDENNVLVTRVDYPADVKMGVVGLMKWELNNPDKTGIQSETISRHSVTYYDMSGDNFYMGYPKSKLAFLRHYKKARF